MNPSRTPDRLLWWILLWPLCLLLALAGTVLYVGLQRNKPVQPLIDGPFHLQAWFLPKAYGQIYPVEYIGPASAAIAVCSTPVSTYYYGALDTMLRLEPNGEGGLKIVERKPLSGQGVPEQWTADGSVLTLNQTGYGSAAAPGNHVTADLRPLTSVGLNMGPTGRFDFGFTDGGTWWYTLLDSGRLAVIEDPQVNNGMARLHLGKPGVTAGVVQEIPDAVGLGDAWQGGNTLAVLARPDKLYVLDPQSERLEERTDLRDLARFAIGGSPNMFCFYFSGHCLIVQDSTRSKLRLYGSGGATLEIKKIDAYSQNFDGTPRGFQPRLMPNLLPFLPSARYGSEERNLRRDGRRAPLTITSSRVGNTILPVGDDRFVLFDEVFCRLTVVEYRPEQDAG